MPVERVLVDAGPLVAVFSAADRHHAECVETLKALRGPLLTVWPAVTEAQYLLGSSAAAQDALLEWIERGGLHPLDGGHRDIGRIRELMRKYADLPMDFTDAVLVAAAERESVGSIFTIGRRDFGVYRPRHVRAFKLLPKR